MSFDITGLIDRDDVKTIAYHDFALETIVNMIDHPAKVAATFGTDSEEYKEELKSLHDCLKALFRTGFSNQAYVTKDGDLSLYINEGGKFVFGMVFHRNRTYDNPPTGRTQPGTWSLHS